MADNNFLTDQERLMLERPVITQEPGVSREILCYGVAPAAGALVGGLAAAPSSLFTGPIGPVLGGVGGATVGYTACNVVMDMVEGTNPLPNLMDMITWGDKGKSR